MNHASLRNLAVSGLSLALSASALADGTETLGVPLGIQMAAGTDYVLAGVGLADSGTGTVLASIPEGSTIRQVLAYWDGLALNPNLPSQNDTILLNGLEVTGTRIGGPSNFVGPYNSFAYRADVTQLGLIGPGENMVFGEGLDFGYRNNGFGLVIVLDNGADTETVSLRDGSDFAYGNFPGAFATTELQVFGFDAAETERTAQLGLFVTGVEQNRPSVLEVTIGSQVSRYPDLFGSTAGAQWDAPELSLQIPAGVTSASVRVLSEDSGEGPAAGHQVSSLNWVVASLSIDSVEDLPQYGCTPGFWSCRWQRFDPWCTGDNYTESLVLTDRFNQVMGVSRWQSGIHNCSNLWSVLGGCGGFQGHWQTRLLNRHAVAALLNADSNINYPYTVDQVRSLYQDAVGATDGPETIWSTLSLFYNANQLGCPW